MQPHQRNRSSHTATQRVASERSESDSVPEPLRRARSGKRTTTLSNPGVSASSQKHRSVSSYIARALLVLALLTMCGLLFAQSSSAQNPPHTNVPIGASFVPPLSPGVTLGLIALLLLQHALLTTAELAFITIRKPRLRQMVEEGNPRALLIERMLLQPTRLMATTQVGTMLAITLSAALAAVGLVPPLANWLLSNTTLIPVSAFAVSLFLVLPPVAVLGLVIGEIVPRSLVIQRSERLSLATIRPVRLLQLLLLPAVGVVTFFSNLLLKPFGSTASFSTPAVNEEELKMMVEASEEQGVLEAEETEMINSILDFAGTMVRKVMTPRIDMTGIERDASLPDLVHTINESGHSRILVYEGDMDNIVGIVHAKDLLPLLAGDDRNDIPISDVMRAPYFIPETKKVEELLAEFRRSKQQLAVVRDEYGTTSGLVTIEDLVEEIVGDIQDEYDVDEPMVQVINETTTILDGKMGLDDVNDRMGLEIPEDESDTIGGFVFGLLGHQALQGESVTWENVTFIVEATDGRRITKVRLVREPEPDDSDIPILPPPSTPAVVANGHAFSQTSRPVEISGVEMGPGVMFRR